MDVSLTSDQERVRAAARALASALTAAATPLEAVTAAAAAGLLRPDDLVTAVLAIDALAWDHPPHAMTLAVQTAVARAVPGDAGVRAGARLGSIALSSDGLATVEADRIGGRVSWVGPSPAPDGLVVAGARDGDRIAAYAVTIEAASVRVEAIDTSAMVGFPCAHLSFDGAAARLRGSPKPVMAVVRLLLSAAGLGMGRRALSEALQAARTLSRTGAGGEQTVQGLLSDAATELDAARLLILKAACAGTVSLAAASMAKLAVTEATQRAVMRATQVVGAETFQAGHVVERLAQDVRALELFAGRTEALREAVADEILA